MKNHAAYSNFLLMQYEKYDESEKSGMIDLLEEFKQEFHYAGSGRPYFHHAPRVTCLAKFLLYNPAHPPV